MYKKRIIFLFNSIIKISEKVYNFDPCVVRKIYLNPKLITLTKLVTVELITKILRKIIDYFDHSVFTVNFLLLVDFNR